MGMRLLASVALALLIPACSTDSNSGFSSVTSTPAEGDDLGGDAPFIRIVSPGPRTTCREGATINVQAVAIDPDASIVRVDFFDGTEHIGTRWSAPFIMPWGALTEGTHMLSAVALDVSGITSVSAPVTVIVTDDDDDHDDDDDGRDPRHGRRRR